MFETKDLIFTFLKEQLIIEEKRGCKIIRTDPDAAGFNIYRLINQAHMHIEQSTIKLTKKSLIGDLSKDLLEAAILSKSKCKRDGSKLIKRIVKNVFSDSKNEKKHCLVCKKKTDHKKN